MSQKQTFASLKASDQYNEAQLEVLKTCLDSGYPITGLLDKNYSADQMQQIYYGYQSGYDITNIVNNQYTPGQIRQVWEGAHAGLTNAEILLYAKHDQKTGKPVYDLQQMQVIKNGLHAGLDVSMILDASMPHDKMLERMKEERPKQTMEKIEREGHYTKSQLSVLEEAVYKGLDTALIQNPAFSPSQMDEILAAQEDQLPPEAMYVLANPVFNSSQMRELRLGFSQGIDAFQYADPRFNAGQMLELKTALIQGLDISTIRNPKYTAMQMNALRNAQYQGVSKRVFDQIKDPAYSAAQMNLLAQAARNGLNICEYVNADMSVEKMRLILEAKKKGISSRKLRKLAKEEDSHSFYERYNRMVKNQDAMGLFFHFKFISLAKHFVHRIVDDLALSGRNDDFWNNDALYENCPGFGISGKPDTSVTFRDDQLDVLEAALVKKIDVHDFLNPDLDANKMQLLADAKAEGLSVKDLTNPELTIAQISTAIQIKKEALEKNLDVSMLIHPEITPSQMVNLFQAMQKGVDITDLLDNRYAPDSIRAEGKQTIKETAKAAARGYDISDARTSTITVQEKTAQESKKTTLTKQMSTASEKGENAKKVQLNKTHNKERNSKFIPATER